MACSAGRLSNIYAQYAHVHRVEVINFRQNVHGAEVRRPRGSRGRHAAQPGNKAIAS